MHHLIDYVADEEHVQAVHVCRGADGGWDVSATLDGVVVAIQHCHDWHRTERVRCRLELELRERVRRQTESRHSAGAVHV